MPDVSLLEPLCSELNISINELLNGERLKNEYTDHLTAETLINYNRFLIRKEKKEKPNPVDYYVGNFDSLSCTRSTVFE